ncbi:MAG: hypothetical protein H6707_09600 [Deltaproteobacteria bacterium]|nr:hypothetical protein [Deltaproteobacteria bacterium]
MQSRYGLIFGLWTSLWIAGCGGLPTTELNESSALKGEQRSTGASLTFPLPQEDADTLAQRINVFLLSLEAHHALFSEPAAEGHWTLTYSFTVKAMLAIGVRKTATCPRPELSSAVGGIVRSGHSLVVQIDDNRWEPTLRKAAARYLDSNIVRAAELGRQRFSTARYYCGTEYVSTGTEG